MSVPRTGNRNSINIRSLGPSHRAKRANRSSVLSTDLLCIPTLPAWAKSTRNPQLQQDLERYLKLSNGASRILSIAQNPLQCLDAAKTLFVSNVQLLSCLRQVQREKMEDAARSTGPILSDAGPSEVDQQPTDSFFGRAKICLSDIRIPLLWRDTPLGTNMQMLMCRWFPPTSILTGAGDTAPDKSDYGDGEQCDGYSVFCLVQVGNTIRDTRLIFNIKPGTTDIEFDDKLIFEDVSPDFHCTIEVYAHPRSSSKATSAFIRRRSQALDVFKKALDQSDPTSFASFASQGHSNYFELIGRCVSTIKDVRNRIRSHTLDVGSQLTAGVGVGFSEPSLVSSPDKKVVRVSEIESSVTNATTPTLYTLESNGFSSPILCDLPLFGNICYRLVAQPYSALKSVKSGLLWIRNILASNPSETPPNDLSGGQNLPGTIAAVSVEPSSSAGSGVVLRRHLPASSVVHSTDTTHSDPHRPHGYAYREPDLTLAITPKTLFLDTRPVHRLISVEALRPVPRPTVPERKLDCLINVIGPRPADGLCDPTQRPVIKINDSMLPCVSSLTDTSTGYPLPTHVSRQSCLIPPHWRSVSNVREATDSSFQSRTRWKSSSDILMALHSAAGPIDMLDPSFRSMCLTSGDPHQECPQNQHRVSSIGQLSSTLFDRTLSADELTSESTKPTSNLHSVYKKTRFHKFKGRRERLSRSMESFSSLVSPQLINHGRVRKPPGLLAATDYAHSSSKTFDDLETESVVSEPFGACEATQSDKSSLSDAVNIYTMDVNLYTFRIATSSQLSHCSRASATEDFGARETLDIAVPSTEVYELAVSTDELTNKLSLRAQSDQPVRLLEDELDALADRETTSCWLDLFRQHVDEQITWGPDAFSHKIVVPQTMPSVCDASARRSMAFADYPSTTFSKLSLSPSLPMLLEVN
ncbi:hypothetical protein P879_02022 [Paragonimus westermani]|uniref:Anillin homology domain-containing protein n=1 Tax=Paragonimus westermani TaxID=34504 RepID=A0A8T0DTN3_9TREM|nr:hypothetical protein P879_02022 [Paragonimus westermani]